MEGPAPKLCDIIVLGATGCTGAITAEYIARNCTKEKWGIAGRNVEQLQTLKAHLQTVDPSCTNLEIFTCDVTDAAQLESLCAKTRVLINCVGPYNRFGEPVVKACVKTGTHYVDITGEPRFVQTLITKFHEEAAKKKLYILPACGACSLIPDVAVQFIKEAFTKESSKAIVITGYLKYNGRYCNIMSHGTWKTFVESYSKRKRTKTIKKNKQKMEESTFLWTETQLGSLICSRGGSLCSTKNQ